MTGKMYGSDGVTYGLTNKGFCDRGCMEVMMLCLVSVTGRMYGSVVLCLV